MEPGVFHYLKQEDDELNEDRLAAVELQSVDLSQRYIDQLPSSIFGDEDAPHGDHSSIGYLNLAHNDNNQLASLPKEIGELKHLRELCLRNNLLEGVPKEFQRLQSIEELNLSGNLLEHFPHELLDLKSLRILYLGGNRIQRIPSAISNLSNLQVLYLGGNALTDIPDIGRLSELTSLGLADNRLEQIPSSIANLRKLRNLALHNNRLQVLPPGIARLKNLEYLSLRNNPLVTDFVNEIMLEPPSLRELAARIVKIRFSPATYRAVLPGELVSYLETANQCVNPRCKGVYFEACAELVKFVDFCGKYRVPLLHYLCSPRCSSNEPAYAYSSSSDTDEEHHHRPGPSSSAKMKKVLLG